MTFSHRFCAVSAILILSTLTAFTQTAGSLDPTFDGDGKVLLQVYNSIPVYAEGMAAQSDGKIVAVVGFATEKLLRLNSDGSLDATFGNGGVVTFSWTLGTSNGNALAVAIQNVGGEDRIVVAGYGPMQVGRNVVTALYVQRFLPSGAVDGSFGTSGRAILNVGYADKLAIQSDGKILGVGVDFGQLVRLDVNGSLDTTFGTGGVVTCGSSRALAVDAAGGILMGGTASVGKGNNSRSIFSVKRYLNTGAADTTFGTSGSARADFGVSVQPWNLALDLLGNIVVSGTASGPAAARFTPNGFADTSFAGTGRVMFPGLPGAGRGLVVQPDGKVVLTGKSNNNFGLVRFNFNGSLDTGFGNGGSVLTDVYGADYSDISVLEMDPGCACPKIVLAGGAAPYTTFARFIVQ